MVDALKFILSFFARVRLGERERERMRKRKEEVGLAIHMWKTKNTMSLLKRLLKSVDGPNQTTNRRP